MCICVCAHDVYNTHTYILPVRALPSPFLPPPGVKGKIPGTLDFVTFPTSMKGRKGLDGVGAGPGSRMPGSPVPTSKSLGLCLSTLLYQFHHHPCCHQSLNSRTDSRLEKLEGSSFISSFGQGLLHHPPRPAGKMGRLGIKKGCSLYLNLHPRN